MDLISVIIPYYKKKEYIQKTLNSVIKQSYKKIESSIIDAYELLAAPEDQELFYDYLIANLKLYFEKFEEELANQVDEPTNQAYDMAKQDQSTQPAEDDIELDL